MGWKRLSHKRHHDDRPAHKAQLKDEREHKEILSARDFLNFLHVKTDPEPPAPEPLVSKRRLKREARKNGA